MDSLKVMVTGAKGFIGQNLLVALDRLDGVEALPFDLDNPSEDLVKYCNQAQMVFHLAGVNRPSRDEEYWDGNYKFTRHLTECLKRTGRKIPLVFSSSIQAEYDNPYGKSKKDAEKAVRVYGVTTDSPTAIFRLPNVFGKWSRPSYNSVVATFCYNIARNLPVQISDRDRLLELVYIDSVVQAFMALLDRSEYLDGDSFYSVEPSFEISLGKLYDFISSFRRHQETLELSDFSDDLTRFLYSTYLSYLDKANFSYAVPVRKDNRGWLFELFKSPYFGQIFVSQTKAGITRGNHYHDTKVEKFCVIQGEAIIRFRNVLKEDVVVYRVTGETPEIVDIPPGYTHSLENLGNSDLITIFWASEVFDHDHPDTHFKKVLTNGEI